MLPTCSAAFSPSDRDPQLNVTDSSADLSSLGKQALRLLALMKAILALMKAVSALMKAMPKGEVYCAFARPVSIDAQQ